MARLFQEGGGLATSDAEIAGQIAKAAPTVNLGIGTALLNDPIYGSELKIIFALYKTDPTKALDLLYASKWGRLRADARQNYLKKLEQSDIYKQDLEQFKLRIREKLTQNGLGDIPDSKLEGYYLNGTPDDLIYNEALQGFKFQPGVTGGLAAERYNTLLETARKNGVSEDKLPLILGVNSIDDVLKSLQLGESISKFEQKIRDSVKENKPKYIQDQLKLGKNLASIYQTYINAMATAFNVDADTIDINDKLLQKAFNEKGALKLNDFQNLIKQDARYLGTPGATGDAQIRLAIKDAILASGATVNDADFNDIVNQAISKGLDPNSPEIRALIRSKISYTAGAKLAGAAGNILEQLRSTGAANGIDVDKTFGSNLQDWIQKVDQGESIETYKRLIRSAASMGLPDNVKKMLDQGLNLESIYGPYRGLMSSVLEINPETITLNDPVLRSAIGPSGETTLYDFQRSLRKDPRWQYTNNARQETSNAVLNVLRNFGFQG